MGACCSKDANQAVGGEFTDLQKAGKKGANSAASSAKGQAKDAAAKAVSGNDKDKGKDKGKAEGKPAKAEKPAASAADAAGGKPPKSGGETSKKPKKEGDEGGASGSGVKSFESDYAPESAVDGNPLFSHPSIPSLFTGVVEAGDKPPKEGKAKEGKAEDKPPKEGKAEGKPPKAEKAQKGDAGKLKLVYFPIQGHAESVRLTLELAAAAYDFEMVDPTSKSPPPFPLEVLPVVQAPGEDRTLSTASEILPYIAERLGLAPSGDDLQKALDLSSACHALREAVVDLRQAILEKADASQIEHLASEVNSSVGPKVLSLLKEQLEKDKGPFLFSKLSFADACAFDAVDQLSRVDKKHLSIDLKGDHEAVWKFHNDFAQVDSIAQYLESPRRFPF